MSDRRNSGKRDRKTKGNHQNGKDKPSAHDAASRAYYLDPPDPINYLIGRKTGLAISI
jgi:hypothetical protein